MKINKMLIAVTAMLAVVLSGCKEDETVGIDASMPMPTNVAYDEVNSSNQSIGVIWDARQAISAGATSFTVQLVKTKDGVADMYDSSTSQTILTTVSTNDATTFSGLTAGRIYYIRIRANYPRSVFSEWTFAMANGEPARIMVGTGIVDESQEETSSIVAKVEEITESTAIARWSTSNYNNDAADAGFNYTVELFKDENCTDLDVSWDVTEGNISISKYSASFIFSGLTPGTDYWFRVTNTTDEVTSDPFKFTTEESQFKTLPETAKAGEVILFQDFHELLWGGDLLNNAGGYSNTARGSATEIDKATGVNPVSAEKYYIVNAGTEMGLFNTLGKAVPNTSLAEWGQMSDASNTGSAGIICARPGMLKLGASSYSAWIVTPELKCLTQPATIEVTFDVAPYDADQSIVVELLDGTKKSNSPIAGNITATSRSVVWRGNAGAEGAGWSQQVVTVPNVTSTCRIAIGAGESGDGAAQHRFYLDNISLKVVSYGELSAPDAPAKPTLTATDKTITASWEEVARAESYTVEYKKTADSEWKVAAEKIAETTCTIEGLEFETQYDVRVKALIGDDLASDYSEVAQITTLAEIKQLATPQNVTAVADYGVATLTFDPVVGATDYEVYANGAAEKLVGMITANAEKVTYKVTGLSFNTAYTFQVKAVAKNTPASELSEATAPTTTSEIVQVKNNVGPTTATVAWRKDLGKYETKQDPVDQYTIQIADNDGTVMGTIDLKTTNYGAAASTLGQHEQGNLNPSRFTFGALEPATTYKVRVKKLGENDLLYSPWCEITTEAAHVKGAKEVLYQGFDEAWYGGDVMNLAGAMQATGTNTSAPVMTWESYIGNTGTNRLADEAGTTQTTFAGAICKVESSSLYGWDNVQRVALRSGYAKFGGGSEPGILITPALGDEVLNATTATPCTISFKAAPYSEWSSSSDTRCEAMISIIVVHADGSETVAIENFDPITSGDPFGYVWKEGSVKSVNLLSTDKLKITSKDIKSNKCRFMFDDLLVVAE